MSDNINIFWFRQDLRLSDNPGLIAAAQNSSVIPIYILDEDSAKDLKMGSASKWWLHHSLRKLNESLSGRLNFYIGDSQTIISNIVKQHKVKNIYWNRCYEPWRIKQDTNIKAYFHQQNIQCKSFNGSLLWEPWEIKKNDGTVYKVFTPFYRNGCLKASNPREPLPPPTLNILKDSSNSTNLDDLKLLPSINWHDFMEKTWHIGEEAAKLRLMEFIEEGLDGYKEQRNYPNKKNVSRLSPYLHFGEISPNQVWHSAMLHGQIKNLTIDLDHFCSELGWREFSYYLLYHFPELPYKNFQDKFDNFPWITDEKLLKAWQQGKTGYPIVDAGMRELWSTGYMHNRVRMIVGSFLVKNLLIHWHHGERWFWDCLIDADLASNSASWQWIAGSGADAAPYFRIFNPVLQGEKFDALGQYTKKYIPELNNLPNKYLFTPWLAPISILNEANIKLGYDYPNPIIDIDSSRKRALEAYKSLSTSEIS
jgi:deoxyribodipyrimidine photo-lyase